MVTSKATLEKIKRIIEKNYKTLTISLLGKKVFTPSEIKQLKDLGIDTDAKDSYLKMVYYHNYLNSLNDPNKPNSLEELKAQQSRSEILPQGEAHDYAIETLNENAKQLIEKLEADFTTKVSNIIRTNNDNYKANALQNLDRSNEADNIVKETTLPRVKREINELKDSAVSDWKRVILTEMNNAIGAGSVDRIVVQNPGKDLNDIFVYRIPVNDAKTCFSENTLLRDYKNQLVRAGDINVGDRLRDPSRHNGSRNLGYYSEVTHFSIKESELFRYELEDGRVLECTKDHPVLIKCKNKVFFFPIGELEDSLMEYEILNQDTMTPSDRVKMGRTPKWVKELGYDDFYYCWLDYGKKIINSFLHHKKRSLVKKEFEITHTCFEDVWLSMLLTLKGIDVSKTANILQRGNYHNKKHIEEVQDKIKFKIENFPNLKDILLQKGIRNTSKLIGIGEQALACYIRNNYEKSFFKKIVSNGRKRASSKMLERLENDEEFRKRRKEICSKTALNFLNSASKPQKKLYDSLKKVYKNAKLEAPVLDRMRVDILIDNVIIEFDGSGHSLFRSEAITAQKDYARDSACKKAGFSVIRVKSPNDNLPDIKGLISIINSIQAGEYKEVYCD